MNTNDDTNGPPIVGRSPLSEDRRTDKAPPVEAASDDGNISALMPPPQPNDLAEGLAGPLTTSLVSRSQAALNPAVVSVSTSSRTISQLWLTAYTQAVLKADIFQSPISRCLREIVQGQRSADAATLAIHHDLQRLRPIVFGV